MADKMAGAFVAFAKTGNPSSPELPWQPYNPDAKPTMIFDTKSRVKSDPDRDLLALLLSPIS